MRMHLKVAAAVLITFGANHARAGGIPVIDVANLVQTVQQVVNDITQINNQVQQITQLQSHLSSINGVRNLGNVFNNPLLKNYVPAEAYTHLNAVNTSGYSGLNTTAKALRDAGMVYNCMDLMGDARTSCQATLAQPYQQKGLLQDAMKSAAGRLSQIQSLMGQINATTDQKSVQEIQARVGAENALLSHEMSQLQMLQGMADSEERIARSRERERQYQMLGRTGKVSDFLP
ncbi:MAG: type IV secretion system protein [Hydrogenophaga sp.]|uniref:type IV secretion system protein n=1 Tax=Hydrogenophaga sp. TaxID=1904254 RepID=UPI00277A7B1B|nr:type IV secretion system protein [Hydrogenophaga sp.]MDP2263747.1 type IV secretion system protein [Hydrogenophaga sp.]MDZ4283850.1 type IV secretion system protein [Hydrogenophaga sp.]